MTKEDFLSLLRGMTDVDDLTIAKEAYRYLAAQAKQDGRRVKCDDLIAHVAGWLKMDETRLANWFNRSKRRR